MPHLAAGALSVRVPPILAMHRILLLAVFCGLPALAGAQAVRCQDPATGRVLYTDQPCPGGELVVPKRSAAELQQEAAQAAQAREAAERREALAVQREQLRLESTRQADAAVRAPAVPAESDACRAARAEASFRAASRTASEEEIRTARANAALACGQPPPAEIVVVPPPPPHWRPPPRPRREPWPERPHPPAPPRYAPGTEPLPMR